MKSAQILKRKINGNELTLGAMSTFHFWPGLVEIVMRAGLDYLIIDLEHLTHSSEKVAEACAIGRRENFPILIRPPAAEMVPLRLAMDLGPCGLLVPYIESVEDMAVIQNAAYVKPRGKRRPGGPGNSWVTGYNYENWKTEIEDDLIILPQIESQAGLDHVDQIASHPLTTAIAVGPYDLSADLGVCWQPQNPKLVNALARIREAGRKAGRNMWMIGDAADLVKRGFTFLCIAEPIALMEGSLTDAARKLRQGVAGTSKPDAPLP
jgi:2-keto-3-deoxy-L-rhamnonate aldolase RhmA